MKAKNRLRVFAVSLAIVLSAGMARAQAARVIGGRESAPLQRSYMVALGTYAGDEFILHCSGFLVDRMWVLTAGHCKTFDFRSQVARMLVHDISKPGGVTVALDKWIRHPEFGADFIPLPGFETVSYNVNDLTLIKLKTPAPDEAFILPIDGGREAPRGSLSVAGWGAIGADSDGFEIFPEALQETYVRRTACGRFNFYDQLDDRYLCTYDGGQHDSCSGDSGAPLVSGNAGNRRRPPTWRAQAMVSFGYGCAGGGHPGVNTDLAFFRTWILQTMREN